MPVRVAVERSVPLAKSRAVSVSVNTPLPSGTTESVRSTSSAMVRAGAGPLLDEGPMTGQVN